MKKKNETAGAEPRTDKEEKGGKKKKFGPVKTSLCIVSAAAIAAVGTWACIAFLRPQQRNDVSEDYGSTVIEVKEGERFDPAAFVPLKERDENEVALSGDDGTYDAVDIYGRLNWTFGQQQNWYSEMHSEVQTAVGIQNVETYKRFSDGILISSDITTSSLVNDAREFCYVGDRVIWRESNESKDKWDGLNTSFSEGAPAGNMPISGEDGFKKKNGLPATELSVYVIRSSTVESAELEVADTAALADGALYTVTYHLIPKTDETGSTGAAAYYGNQMVFSGGIDAPPTFNYITVSFTFTEDWFPVSCSVAESYTAAMKTIVSTCTSTSLTEYTYGVPELGGEVEEIYESYYKQYADSAATGEGERELTATDCLAGAFSPILSGPCCLDLGLDIDGKQVGGNVYLDLGGALEGDLSGLAVRAKLGDALALYVEGGVAYVNYGNVKLSMGVSDLMGLFATESAAAEEGTETSSTDDLLARLVEGEFTHDETHARLHSLLPLGDIEADITFDFNVDENKNVTLGGIDAVLELGGEPINIHAAFCENGPAPLTDAQKAEYADAATAASYLKEVISSGLLRLDLAYTNEELGLALQGTLDLAIADGFALHGAFTLTTGGDTKEIGIAYDGTSVYVNVDGIKVKATVTELVSFLVQLLPSGDAGGSLGLSSLLGSLFDAKFAENFTSTEAGDVLRLTLGGTQILRALGVEFDLGDLTLELSGNGCTLSALGAKLTLQKGAAFTVDTEGYAEVVPYVLNLYQLFTYGNVAIDFAYQNEAAALSLDGQIIVDTTNAVAVANLDVTYGAVKKTLTVTYQENTVYLNLDGLKLKANVNEIAGILSSAMPQGETDLSGILGAVLSLNFSKIVPELKNGKGTLELQLALDELLQSFGVDLSLGTADIVVSRSGLDITAEGVAVSVMRAERAPVLADDLDTYVELAPAVKTVADILSEGLINATIEYRGDFDLTGTVDLDITSLKARVDLTINYQGAEKNIKGYFVNDGNIYLDVDGLKVSVAIEDISSLLAMIPMATEETLSPVETLLSQIGELLQAEETESGLKLTVALDNILSAFGVTLNTGKTEIVIDDSVINISTLDGALAVSLTAGQAFETETEGYAEVLPYVMGLYEMFLNENVSIELAYFNQDLGLDLDGQIIVDTTNAVAVANLDVTYGAVEKTLTVTYQENTVYLNLDGLKLKANVNEIAGILSSALPQGETDLSGILGAVLSLNFSKIVPELKNGKGTLEIQLALDELLQSFGVDLSLGTADIVVSRSGLDITAEGIAISVLRAEKAPVLADDLDTYVELAPAVKTVADILGEGLIKATVAYQGDFDLTGTVDLDITSLKARVDLTISYQGAEKAIKGYFVNDGNTYLDVDGLKVSVAIEDLASLLAMIPMATEETLSPVETLLSQIGELLQAEATENGLKLTVALDNILSAFGVTLNAGKTEIVIDDSAINISTLDGALEMTLTAGQAFTTETEGYAEVLPYVMGLYEMFLNENVSIDLAYFNQDLDLDGQIIIDTTNAVAVAELDITYGAVEKTLTVTYQGNTVYLNLDGLKLKANVNEIAGILSSAMPQGETDLSGILGAVLSLNFSKIVPELKNGKGTLELQLALDELLQSFGVDLSLGTAKVSVSDRALSLDAGKFYLYATAAKTAPVPAKNLDSYADIAPFASVIGGLLAEEYLRAELSYRGDIAVEGTVDIDLGGLNVSAALQLSLGEAQKTIRIAFLHAENLVYLDVDGIKIGATTDELGELIQAFTASDGAALAPVETLLKNLGAIVKAEKAESGAATLVVALDELLSAFGMDVSDGLGTLEISANTDKIVLSAADGALAMTLSAGESFEVKTEDYVEILPYVLAIKDLLSRETLKIALGFEGSGVSLAGDIYLDLSAGEGEPVADASLGLVYGSVEKKIGLTYLGSTVYLSFGGLGIKADVAELASFLPAGGGDVFSMLGKLLSLNFSELIPALESGENSLQMKLALDKLVAALGFSLDGFRLGTADVTVSEAGVALSMGGLSAAVSAADAMPEPHIEEENFTDIAPLAKTLVSLLQNNSYLSAALSFETGELAIEGEVKLDIVTLIVEADLTLAYGGAEKDFTVAYVGDGMLYVTVDGFRLMADIDAATELISSLTKETKGDLSPVESLLENLEHIVDFKSSDGTFEMTVALEDILKMFGIDFATGDATIAADGEKLKVTAFGGDLMLDVTRGQKFTVSTRGYIEVVTYVQTVLDLLSHDTVDAAVSLTLGDIGIEGTLTVQMGTGKVFGDLSVAGPDLNVKLGLAFFPGDDGILSGTLLADINGFKIKGTVSEIVSFVGSILNVTGTGMGSVSLPDLQSLLPLLLSMDLREHVSLMETVGGGSRTLTVTLSGTDLVEALLPDLGLDLGMLTLRISDGELALSMQNGDVKVTEGKGAPDIDEAAYADIGPIMEMASAILSGGCLTAELNYRGAVTVSGPVTLSFQDPNALKLAAKLAVAVGDGSIPVGLYYGGDTLYLDLGGAMLKTSVEKVKELVAAFSSGDDGGALGDFSGLLGNLGGLLDDLGGLLTNVKSEDGTFTAGLALKELLQALGVTADVPTDITLSVGEGKLTLSMLEDALSVAVTAGGEISAPEDASYTDISDVLDFVMDVAEKKGIGLKAEGTLSIDGQQIHLCLENAGITWDKGFAFRGDIVLSAFSSAHRIQVYATAEAVKIAYGTVGAEIVFDDFTKIGNAFGAVTDTIWNYIAAVLGTTPDKAEEEIASALTLAEGGEALSGLIGTLTGWIGGPKTEWNFDLAALLGGLTIGASERENGILHLALSGISADLFRGEEGLSLALALSLDLPAAEGSEAHRIEFIDGALALSVPEAGLAEMPDFNYLDTDAFINIIGYLGSAVDLLKTTDLSLTFNGTVTAPDTDVMHYPVEKEGELGTKYKIDASIQTHRGGENLFHLEIGNRNFWIDSDVYIHASINIIATGTRKDDAPEGSKSDSSLYIDVYILDGGPNGSEADNNPDFYVTLSQFGPVGSTEATVPGYNPVKLYAPADEIMTLLSSALPLFGIDVGILNEFMVFKWITDPNVVNQFKAFSTVVAPLLNGLLGGAVKGSEAPETPEGADVPAETPEGSDAPATPTEFDLGKYLKEIALSDVTTDEGQNLKELKIVLNSEGLYGIAELDDVTATLTKTLAEFDENGKFTQDGENYNFGHFATLDLLNIYDKDGAIKTSLKGSVVYDAIEPATLSGDYRSFLGAEKLLQALAKSATHVTGDIISGEETYHTYEVNQNFYIDGKISANLNFIGIINIDVTIQLVAVSITVDKDGTLGINIRLEYKGVHDTGINVINGDSKVDITIKNGMVYMKRVQTNYYDSSSLLVWEHDWVDYSTPIILYRAMPLDNFMSDILNQLGFILNFGNLLTKALQSAGGSSTEPGGVVDFGQRLDDVLKVYTYAAEAKDGSGNVTSPASWDLTLNGDALAKGVLGDLNIGLSEDTDGYIRNLSVKTSIVSIITVTASLRWRNPGGEMESGAEDKTHDVSTEIGNKTHGMGAMIEKLNEIPEGKKKDGWDDPATPDVVEGPVFLEAKDFTVTYMYNNYGGGTTQLGTQTVMVSTGADGYGENTLYSELFVPDLPDDGYDLHVLDMDLRDAGVGKVLPADTFYAQQYKYQYTVKFWSPEEIDDTWEFDAPSGKWWRKFDMEYGAKVTFKAKGDEFGEAYTVTNDNAQEVELPDKPPYEEGVDVKSHWTVNFNQTGTEFTVLYDIDTVTYRSDVAFKVGESDTLYNEYSEQFTSDAYPLITPTAEGYTFLGWYQKQADGSWEKVNGPVSKGETDPIDLKVEALWEKTAYDYTLSGNKENKGGFFSPNYHYDVTITEHNEELAGAFLNELTRKIKYEFCIDTTLSDYVIKDGTFYEVDLGNNAIASVHVRVTITYTDKNNNVIYERAVSKTGTYNIRGELR